MSEIPSQRWEQPFNFAPGHWKRQLPAKYLAIAARSDVAALQQLIDAHPDFLSKRGPHNRTLLWEATRKGKLAAVRWLVEAGADLDATGCYNSESMVQLTPYCAAVYYRRTAVADYLRSRNPQFDIFRAAFLGDRARVERMLADSPELLNAEDPHDHEIYCVPLISFAVVGGHFDLTLALIKRGATLGPYSAQLLHLAAKASRMDLVELLISNGADARAVDSGIFVAASDLRILRYLLDHGASATRPGKNRMSPLDYVRRGDKGKHPEKVKLLLEYK